MSCNRSQSYFAGQLRQQFDRTAYVNYAYAVVSLVAQEFLAALGNFLHASLKVEKNSCVSVIELSNSAPYMASLKNAQLKS